QEGPGVGGSHGPYLQSERHAIYDRYYAQLIDAGLAYPCFCSDQSLKLVRKRQLAAGQPPRYPGTCARLTPEEAAAKRAQGIQPTLRFQVPKGQVIEFDDLVRGRQSYRSDDIGDFIIRRSDGTPAFFFTNAIDDALMEVTHVLRGEDHVTNTPRQLLLLKALGLPAPAYGHIALIVGPAGGPLSKREGSASVRGLRERGYLPLAINNHLARIGHTYESDAFMSMDELAANFDIARLGRAAARHDEAQLRHRQQQAVAALDDEAMRDWLLRADCGLDRVPASDRLAFIRAVRENVTLPEDARRWVAAVHDEELQPSAEAAEVIAATDAGFFAAALEALPAAAADFRAYAKAVGEAAGVKGKGLFMPLRAALTGEVHGPEMSQLLPLIGEARARARLTRWLIRKR
ncbi:MAG TPA: glutamate--tRNA ligase, partial [Thioalkalivibrio sp.]|nr:glutamate--tRNA ligase [Thioalkalivibrio sp.]